MVHEELDNHEVDDDVLPPGVTLLHGQYMIESYLVRGGFGVTYLARAICAKRWWQGAMM